MVRTSQKCDLDLVINGSLVALVNQHIFPQLYCDATAEAGASAWLVKTRRPRPRRLRLGTLHIHCIRVKPSILPCLLAKYGTQVRAMRQPRHSPGP